MDLARNLLNHRHQRQLDRIERIDLAQLQTQYEDAYPIELIDALLPSKDLPLNEYRLNYDLKLLDTLCQGRSKIQPEIIVLFYLLNLHDLLEAEDGHYHLTASRLLYLITYLEPTLKEPITQAIKDKAFPKGFPVDVRFESGHCTLHVTLSKDQCGAYKKLSRVPFVCSDRQGFGQEAVWELLKTVYKKDYPQRTFHRDVHMGHVLQAIEIIPSPKLYDYIPSASGRSLFTNISLTRLTADYLSQPKTLPVTLEVI